MSSHIRGGIAFIALSLFAGWLLFRFVNAPSQENSATEWTEGTEPLDNGVLPALPDTDGIAATQDYQTCLDQSGGVTANMLDCIGAEFERADGMLNVEYRRLVASLAPSDEANLRAAQRNWISARDTTCENQAAEHGDGTLYTVTYNACLVDQTVARVGWLRNYAPVGNASAVKGDDRPSGALVGSPIASSAQTPRVSVDQLKLDWSRFDFECQNSLDETDKELACTEREATEAELTLQGLCRAGAQWEEC